MIIKGWGFSNLWKIYYFYFLPAELSNKTGNKNVNNLIPFDKSSCWSLCPCLVMESLWAIQVGWSFWESVPSQVRHGNVPEHIKLWFPFFLPLWFCWYVIQGIPISLNWTEVFVLRFCIRLQPQIICSKNQVLGNECSIPWLFWSFLAQSVCVFGGAPEKITQFSHLKYMENWSIKTEYMLQK